MEVLLLALGLLEVSAQIRAGGGGGGGGGGLQGGAAGSGVVILRYPRFYKINAEAGICYCESNVGNNSVAVITSGTGNIFWTI